MCSPLDLKIFDPTQTQYLIEILSKKHRSNQNLTEDEFYQLEETFHTAKVTCEVLVANMVSPDMINNIFFSHYKKVTDQNAIKLLMRCNQLYTARAQALTILKLSCELDVYFLPRSQFCALL